MSPLSEAQTKAIQNNFPNIPKEYLDWITQYGWGENKNGYMIYSSPAYSSDILGDECPNNIREVVLVGDDMAGYLIGFLPNRNPWKFVGIDSADWEIEEIRGDFRKYME